MKKNFVRAEPLFFLFVLLASSLFAFDAFFTAPPNEGNLKPALLELLESAKSSIHTAIYSLDDDDVIRTLHEAAARGVDVKIVMEGENYLEHIETLSALDIVADPIDNGLMHEKFTVVDGRYVWMGSANFTRSSLYNDFNNAVLFDSQVLAKVMDGEFELMRKGYFAAVRSPSATVVLAEGVKTEIFFSPSGGGFEGITETLKRAEKEVDVAVYAFSDIRIAMILMALRSRGVKIRVLADSVWNDSPYSVLPKMEEFPFFEKLHNRYGLLHDKYIVVDPGTPGAKVVTGSYNLTLSAQNKNNETVFIIHSPEAAKAYLDDFEAMQSAAENGQGVFRSER